MTAADIVSSARIVMTAIVLMGSTSLPIVAENVRAWRIFRTKPGNNHGQSRDPRSARLHEKVRTTGASSFETHRQRGVGDAPHDEVWILMARSKTLRVRGAATPRVSGR